jgi:hypothetical protein
MSDAESVGGSNTWEKNDTVARPRKGTTAHHRKDDASLGEKNGGAVWPRQHINSALAVDGGAAPLNPYLPLLM